jgi:Flp pilus assembly protein TadD
MTRRGGAPAAAPSRSASPSPAWRAAWLALLGVVTFAAFRGALAAPFFLLDDPYYVYDDPFVRRGLTLEGVAHFLARPQANTWHPLTSLSHMLDVQLFGLNPAAHHATSVLIHVANVVLLAIVLARLTGAWWRSLLAAALFGLHPLRVESVAWISERKDVLSALFFVLTLGAYHRWSERPSPARGAMVIATMALGLMAKPMLVTLPFVLVLLDVWPLGRLAGGPPGATAAAAPKRSLAGLVAEKWPLLLIAAIASVVTFWAQLSTGAVQTMTRIPLGPRVANALVSYWRYVGHTLWPRGLAVHYPFLPVTSPLPGTLAAIGLVIATVLALRQSRQRPWLTVGWLWYVGMLVPVIGLIQVGVQSSADRYTYLPGIGLVIAIVWGLAELATSVAARRALVAIALVVLALLGAATVRNVARWRDARELFRHAIAVTRDNAVAEQGLGNALIEAGDPAAAIPHLETAYRLHPDLPDLEANLGSALGSTGRYEEAIVHLRSAVKRKGDAGDHHNLAAALAGAGRLDEAIGEYRRALALDPDRRRTLAGLASVLAATGRGEEAMSLLRRAIELAENAGAGAEAENYRRTLMRLQNNRR